MSYSETIKFKVNECPLKRKDGSTRYQGQVIHNQALGPTEALKGLCARMGNTNVYQTQYFLDSIFSYAGEELAKGNSVNFGPFSAKLKLRGSFPAANSPFDEKVNSLTVELSPGAKLKAAVKSLKAENATELKPQIYEVLQVKPKIEKSRYYLPHTIYSDGHRDVHVNGCCIRVHPEAADEGVWIESDAGERLAAGAVYRTDTCCCDFTLDTALPPGLHWLAIYSRIKDDPQLYRADRRITVIDR